MGTIEIIVLGLILFLAVMYWRKNQRVHEKQCPECGAYVHEDDAVCKYCQYKFF